MEKLYTRRNALKLGLAVGLIPTVAHAAETPVLVELFTSQGCSDCPPADKLAGELMSQPGVTVVSLNVDYWDYLGWKDTLGKPEYSKRQADYARTRGDGEVYTPQMVINGAAHAVGSNREAVESAIAAARAKPAVVPVTLTRAGGDVTVNVGAGAGNGTVYLMALTSAVSVPIARGENAGTHITYHNVVRKLTMLGDWNGGAVAFKSPLGTEKDISQLVAIVQKAMAGELFGLASITLS